MSGDNNKLLSEDEINVIKHYPTTPVEKALAKQLEDIMRENEQCKILLKKISPECEDGLTTKVYEEIYSIIDKPNKEPE